MVRILVVLIALTITIPFKDWIKMDIKAQADFINYIHQIYHQQNPSCSISVCLGVPRKEVRKFKKDRVWIDFTVDCAKWKKEFSIGDCL